MCGSSQCRAASVVQYIAVECRVAMDHELTAETDTEFTLRLARESSAYSALAN